MAISNAMRAALRAISYPEPDIRKSYLLERRVKQLTGKPTPRDDALRRLDSTLPLEGHSVPLRIYYPPDQEEPLIHRNPVILFFHGGGWVLGCLDSYDPVCLRLARLTGLIVVSVEYRLAPEHPFPAGVEDCFAAATALGKGAILPGVTPEQIILMGDSAGGNLAAAVSLMLRDRMELPAAAQVLIYPALWNDYTETSPFPSVGENGSDFLLTARRMRGFMEMYRGEEPFSLPEYYLAPLLCDDLSHQPPTLIITAEYCPLRDEGEQYAGKLREAGNSVTLERIPDALHNFFVLSDLFSAVRQTHQSIQQFLGQCFPEHSFPELPWNVPMKAPVRLAGLVQELRERREQSEAENKESSDKSTPPEERSLS